MANSAVARSGLAFRRLTRVQAPTMYRAESEAAAEAVQRADSALRKAAISAVFALIAAWAFS